MSISLLRPLCLFALALSLGAGCSDCDDDNSQTNNLLNNDRPDTTPDLVDDAIPDLDVTPDLEGDEAPDLEDDEEPDSDPTLCAENERVVANMCQACAPGTANPAGDDPDGDDTECAPVTCEENQQVTANACVPCAPGSTRPAGDDASAEDTSCEATLCAEDERVQGNACVACAPGATNEVGDDATGADTMCDDGCSVVLGVSCDAFEQGYLKASNTEASELFGHAVALSGDTLVVSAFQEDSAATGINGDQSDNTLADSGAVYVFTRTNGTWSQQAYLKASNTSAGGLLGDYFGFSVAIDGDTLVVGAIGEDSAAPGVNGDQADDTLGESGAAYVFTRTNGTWSQQAYLKASNPGGFDFFGNSVAISGDTIAVGANNEGSSAVGIGGDGVNDDAMGSGAVYVFARQGTDWSQQAYIKASNTDAMDQFGQIVRLSGDTLAVGAPNEASSARGVNGDGALNNIARAGAAYVFVRQGTSWSQQAYIKASNSGNEDGFGYALDVDADTLVVGALNERSAAAGVNADQTNNSASDAGAAYVFVRQGTDWSQQAYLKSSNPGAGDNFGYAVAVSGDRVVIGAQAEASSATGINGDGALNDAEDGGAVYTFTRQATDWSLTAYLKASNTGAGDLFGFSVDLEGGTLAVGAPSERSNATGVGGSQTDDSLEDAGAVYVRQIAP